jgi:ABC-type lipoprotein export system ATPase subunit
MLKINNLNKYYNRRKSNQIHVLNDINLTFPENGLVTILGASGSGKTTLLNAICGLDSVDSGSIDVGGYHLKKYQSGIWDKLRSEHFGYVFQNYNLFLDKTVFENVALSLRLLGIRDAGVIKERTLYTLGCVGMEKYKNRLAGSLSGGEQQRVAIARALVKDAKIIIADEPTGNLDEKNTVEIMNLIKKISQTRLVVLVTHERDMASFYSDRIIEIKDGKIMSDSEMTENGELSLSDEKNIYLADLSKATLTSGEDKNINAFNDAAENHYDIKLVIQGKNLYILASSKDLNVKYLDHDSEIKLIDAHRPVITKENLVLKDFDIQPLAFSGNRRKAKISFGQYFKMGLG